jgi:hypothetical protein
MQPLGPSPSQGARMVMSSPQAMLSARQWPHQGFATSGSDAEKGASGASLVLAAPQTYGDSVAALSQPPAAFPGQVFSAIPGIGSLLYTQ